MCDDATTRPGKNTRIYTTKVQEALSKAAGESLSDACYIGRKSSNQDMKTALFHFVNRVLKKLAQKKALDEVYDRSIQCRTESSTFEDALARRALTSFPFVRLGAKFVCKNLKECSNVIGEEKSLQHSLFSFPKTWLL